MTETGGFRSLSELLTTGTGEQPEAARQSPSSGASSRLPTPTSSDISQAPGSQRHQNRRTALEDRPDIYEYLAAIKREVEKDDPPKCSTCGDAGYVRVKRPIHDSEFGKIESCRCRTESQEMRQERLLRWSQLPSGLWGKTFATYSGDSLTAQRAANITQRFVRCESDQHILTLYGEAGSGKTHLAAAAINLAAYLGSDAFFVNIPAWLNACRLVFSLQGEVRHEAEMALQAKIGCTKLLVLDDVGVQASTDWATEKLFVLVNERIMDGKRLIATVNDISVQDRLISRLADRNSALCIQAGDRDHRLTPSR